MMTKNVHIHQGKVFLLVGPQSSGKSTFLLNLLRANSKFTTINRKRIIDQVNNKATELFLSGELNEIKAITGIKVHSFHELNLIDISKLDDNTRFLFLKVKDRLIRIIDSNFFDNYVQREVFSAYYLEAKHLLTSGLTIIIDESLVNSQASLDLFISCFNHYSHIKIILLFNLLSDVLDKTIIRNNKFFSILESEKSIDRGVEAIKNDELRSGNSESSLRQLIRIIIDYQNFYYFNKMKPQSDCDLLYVLTRVEFKEFLDKIAIESVLLHKRLTDINYFHSVEINSIDLNNILKSIMGELEKVYLTCKFKYDYVLTIDNLNNIFFRDQSGNISLESFEQIVSLLERSVSIKKNSSSLFKSDPNDSRPFNAHLSRSYSADDLGCAGLIRDFKSKLN